MNEDPILREIREFRDRLAERFKDDPQGFLAWIKAREEESRRQGRTFVTRRPKRVEAEAVSQR